MGANSSRDIPHEGGSVQVFRFISGMFGTDVGIDLGTANMWYTLRERDSFNEPSAVAIRKNKRRRQNRSYSCRK